MRKLLGTEALPGDRHFALLPAFLPYRKSLHLLCSVSHSFLPFCFLPRILCLVSAFQELWPTTPLCGLTSASWLLYTCVQLLQLLPPSLFTHCRALTENLIALICLFTPGRRMDCRPTHRLAAAGQLPTFGLTAGKIVMHNPHGHPDGPSNRAIIRDGYLRKGVSIIGFLFDNFSFCFFLSSLVFKSI